jgi:hypothetical protein
MPEQALHATETNHAEEVLDVVLPADHQPTKIMQPGKQPFHSPTSAVAAQRTTILRRRLALSTMRCDHLDATAFGQISIQAVTVIGLVADQSRREVIEEAFDEFAFVRRSAFDTNGKRKTVIIGESDDFRALAAFGEPDREAPFFAPVKEASMKASSSCSFPRACNSSAKVRKMRSNLPSRTHGWKRRWQVWYGGCSDNRRPPNYLPQESLQCQIKDESGITLVQPYLPSLESAFLGDMYRGLVIWMNQAGDRRGSEVFTSPIQYSTHGFCRIAHTLLGRNEHPSNLWNCSKCRFEIPLVV